MTDDLAYVCALARSAAAQVEGKAGRVERLSKTHASASDETVTACDRAAQRIVLEGLRARFPHDGFIGEESDDGGGITHLSGGTRRMWVVDPIDGTNNFVAGMGCWAVCIGLLQDGYPVLGVVHDAAHGTTYAAARGAGAYVNGRRVQALAAPMTDNALMMMTCNLVDCEGRLPAWFVRWTQRVMKMRMLGTCALELVQVGAGVAHGAITIHGKLWDFTAAAAVVLEAGGSITDFAGRDIFPFDTKGYAGAKVPFVAAAPGARDWLLAELAS